MEKDYLFHFMFPYISLLHIHSSVSKNLTKPWTYRNKSILKAYHNLWNGTHISCQGSFGNSLYIQILTLQFFFIIAFLTFHYLLLICGNIFINFCCNLFLVQVHFFIVWFPIFFRIHHKIFDLVDCLLMFGYFC